MSNPFDQLNKIVPQTDENNPFNSLSGKNLTGQVTIPDSGPTHFALQQSAIKDANDARLKSEEANSFWGITKATLNPINLVKAGWDVASTVVKNPVESAKQAALGLASGLTLGGTDWLQRKAFVDEAIKGGLSEEEARSIADNMLQPEDTNLQAIRGGANLASFVVPYAGIEKAFISGIKYASPAFVAKYSKAAKLLSDIGAFNVAGQIDETFRGDATAEERLKRAALDTASAGVFGAAGSIYRRIRGTPFKSPFETAPVTNPNTLVPEGIVVSENTLREGAQSRIDELSNKAFLRGDEPAQLKFLKENIDNPDALYSFNSNPPKAEIPVPDAKASMTIQVPSSRVVGNAEVAAADGAKAVETGTTKINVATNDMEALQSYIKGSNDIDYKIVKDLGKDAKGNPIQARFEAKGGTDGRPVIYATDETTASNLGHELGHYFDNKLTASVDGKLSSLLPDFEKNRTKIEDTLGSLAIKNLGGEATSEKISAEVSKIASDLKREIDVLSSNRRGSLISSKSERFADAVSEVLTKEGAAAEAPTLTALLKHSEAVDTATLFGEKVAKELKSIKTRIPDNVITVDGKTFELSGEAKAKYLAAKQASDAHVESIKSTVKDERANALLKGEGMRMAATKRELTGQYTATELNKLIEKERSNYLGKEIEVTINGKKVNATIETRPAFGNVKVKLENGDVISVKTSTISPDSRPVGDIIQKVTARPDVKPYEPQVIKSVLEEPKAKPVEKPVEKVVEKAPDLGRTETGKQPNTPAIRAEKITTDAETEAFINTKILPKLTGAERVGKSNADIIERSYSSNLTQDSFDNILKERFGNLSEDVVKAKRILTDGASNLKESLAGRSIADLSGEELKTVMSDYSRLVQTFEVFAGVRTELSNSFRSLGLGVAPGENDVLRSALETIQKAIGNEKDPFEIMKKVVAAQEKGAVAKYFEVWYPALLSGPKTSVRNIVGNASNLTVQTLSKLFTKQGRSEFLPTVNGIIAGQKEALNKAMSVLKGESAITSKIVEGAPLEAKSFKGKLAFLNNLEYVGRFLNAQDAYFNSLAKDGEIAAIRKGAIDYGLKDTSISNAINEAVGQQYAQMTTFRNNFEKTFVGEIASKVSALKSSDNAAVKSFANFFVPFVKTVANITDRRVDFLPIFNLARTFSSPELYEQRASRILADTGLFAKMMAQGADEKLTGAALKEYAQGETDRVKQIIIDRLRNQQLGRFYMGTAAMAAGIPLAVAGRITGSGPDNKNERDTLMASGWRPNSIIMPDGVALPYQNLISPLSSILSVLGNISDAVKYKKEKSSVSSATIDGMFKYMKSELDQSFLSGISNLYDGLTGYTPKEQVLSNLAANLIPIPAAWSQTKDILFPERYNAKTFNDIMKNKLGITGDFFGTGLTTPLQPNINAFGEQVKADLIYGLTPPELNSKKDDPVLNFMLENGISIGKPQQGQNIKGRRGEKRDITPEEYTAYAKASGAKIYDELKNKIESGYFNRFKTESEKKDAMDKIVTEIRTKEKSKINY